VRVTFPDLAKALQARIHANLETEKMDHAHSRADEPPRIDILQLHIAALEEAASEAEVLAERRRQQAEEAAKKIAEPEPQIATLRKAIAKAEAGAPLLGLVAKANDCLSSAPPFWGWAGRPGSSQSRE
jgi:hypothetical protein